MVSPPGHAVRRRICRDGRSGRDSGSPPQRLESISAGYGFSGIVVALFGGLHPLGGAIPASIVFGLLIVGADMMQRAVQVPAYIILAIQGLIILSIVSSSVFITKKGMKAKVLKFLTKMTGGRA